MPVVSAGAAGPAGAQAEWAGARGKSAAFFSFFLSLFLLLFLFNKKWDFARLHRGWGIYKGTNVAMISFLSLLFLSPIGKRARSASGKLSQFFPGRLVRKVAGRSRRRFRGGQGETRRLGGGVEGAAGLPRGLHRRAPARVGAGWLRRRPRQVSGGRAACSA